LENWKGAEKGICSLFQEKENVIHILTTMRGDNRERKNFF
jgi:hypothetical protein